MKLVWVVVTFVACVRSQSVTCDDGTQCPQGTTCVTLTVPAVVAEQCAPPGSVEACANLGDFAACMLPSGVAGSCYATAAGHACLPGGCGNGIVDPDEACDDGNAVAGDGCSDSCKSTEVCGNGIVDPVTAEVCDDGNHQSHDGCAFDCDELETAVWLQQVSGSPPARADLAMTYDASTHQIIAFGGDSVNELGDTWAYQNAVWTQLANTGPPARADASIAYDSVRHRVVIFGGSASENLLVLGGPHYFEDTWEWDGLHWLLAASSDAVHPVSRAHAAMAYDRVRQRVVLFGGAEFGGGGFSRFYNDTWEWDGTVWTAITTSHAPSARDGAAMAYDATAGKIILFGGDGDTNDTWSYDGTDWSLLTPATSPTGRGFAQMTTDLTTGHLLMYGGTNSSNTDLYELWRWTGLTWAELATSGPQTAGEFGFAIDPDRGKAVVFGGDDNVGNALAQTWEWDGTVWKQNAPTTPVLRDHGGAYDVARGRAVVFGGGNAAGIGADGAALWELDDKTWTQVTPTGMAPTGRHDTAMAYDVGRQVTMVFGGCTGNCSAAVSETWLWNGSTWQRDLGTQPPGRIGGMLAYDGARHQIVLFGGFDPNTNVSLADTWVWNGSWSMVVPATSPVPRAYGALAYDPIAAKVVMFGGVDAFGFSPYNDTWTWDGTTWTQIAMAGLPPPPRWRAAFAWSPDRKHVVLYGGADSINTALGDTWELDASGWTQLFFAIAPPPRSGAQMFPTRDGSGVVVFGGTPGETNVPAVTDAWTLAWSNEAVLDDSCRDQSDSDGDGAVGCADTDCWARCTPECLPSAPCDATAPRCGDGTCNANLETCRSCPGDCTCAVVCGDYVCDPGETCPGDCGS